jgi:hypothetical protein
MPTRFVLLAVGALALAAPAPAAPERVVAVPGLDLSALDDLAKAGAVGLVVPDAGPRTSRARALAALERGTVVNSLRDEPASGRQLVRVRVASRLRPLEPGTVVVGIPAGGHAKNQRRYPIALIGPQRGLLTSSSTRLDGIVSMADVAHDRLRVVPSDDPAAEARDLDERIHDNARARPRAAEILLVVVGALVLLRPRAAVLAFATIAVANLALGALGVSEPSVVIALLVLAALAALPLSWALRGTTALGAALAGTVGLYLLGLAIEPAWVALSPLGPTQNARFYGFSNLLETVLLVPVLGGAALLGRRYGPVALAAVAAASLVAVAGSRFGADAGGAVVLAAGFAVLGIAAVRRRRSAFLVVAAVALAVLAAAVLDALAGPSTHLTETLRGGPDEVARDLWERIELSWYRATDVAGAGVLIGCAVVLLAVLVARGPRRPLPLAVAAAVFTSLLVNDSPKEVAFGGLLAYLAVARLPDPSVQEAPGYNSGTPKEESRQP